MNDRIVIPLPPGASQLAADWRAHIVSRYQVTMLRSAAPGDADHREALALLARFPWLRQAFASDSRREDAT